MEEAIEDRRGDDRVAEDLAPRPETMITRDDARAPLVVAEADELKEEIGPLPVDRNLADLVDNDQMRLGEELEPPIGSVLGQCLAEGGAQAGRRGEQRAVALRARGEAERQARWALPTPAGPREPCGGGWWQSRFRQQSTPRLGCDVQATC